MVIGGASLVASIVMAGCRALGPGARHDDRATVVR